jgi:hypothetical protein
MNNSSYDFPDLRNDQQIIIRGMPNVSHDSTSHSASPVSADRSPEMLSTKSAIGMPQVEESRCFEFMVCGLDGEF